MSKKEIYREGCDPDPDPKGKVSEEVPEPKDAHVHVSAEGSRESKEPQVEGKVPVTAFLVMVLDYGVVEAVVGLPESVKRQRNASMRDVRDACAALYSDAVTTMTIEGCAQSIAKSIAKATEAQFVQRVRQQIGSAR